MEQRTGRVGLGYGLIIYGFGLILGALLLVILNQPFEMMLSQAGQHTSSTAAETGQRYMERIWGAMPLVIMAISGFGIIARANREREVGP